MFPKVKHLTVILAASLMALALVAVPSFATSRYAQSSLVASHTRVLLTAGDHPKTFVLDGVTRFYIVHVPPGKPVAGRPLILVFPGSGDTASTTISKTNFEQVANQTGDVVAFLQGYADIFDEGTGNNPARRARINDVAYTSAVLNALLPLVAYDSARVAAAGFSNGAMMVELLGCRLAARLSLIVPVEGELPAPISPGCAPSRALNISEIHATADPVIPYNGGTFAATDGPVTVLSAPQSAQRWATIDGCTAGPVDVTGQGFSIAQYVHCRSGVTVTLRTIAGGSHVWGSNIGQIVTQALGH
jgi:polyhydroxybutyrate depolymerase